MTQIIRYTEDQIREEYLEAQRSFPSFADYERGFKEYKSAHFDQCKDDPTRYVRKMT